MSLTLLPSRPFVAAALYSAAAVLVPGSTASAAPVAFTQPLISPVRQLEAAAEIADLGRDMRDPILLIAASRMIIASGVKNPVSRPLVSDVSATSYDPWSTDILLAEARALVATDTALQALIRETSESKYRGLLTGPSQTDEIIMPGEVQRFAFTFVARERADAGLRIKSGPIGAALSLEAIDNRGQRVAKATSPARFNQGAYVEWTPKLCGAFTIIVRNMGSSAAAYRLSTAPSEAGVDRCKTSVKPLTRRKAVMSK